MDVMQSFSLKGKMALVTGGAGLYGQQIVSALAEAGAKTFMASRNLKKLQVFADSLRNRGYDVYALEVDLSNEESIYNLYDKLAEEYDGVDILVNNAVTRIAYDAWNQSMDIFDRSLRINASSLFKITYLFSEPMKKRKYGSIINISSIMGMTGIEMANYAGTDMNKNPSPIYFYEKGGMINFTRWAASILGPYNIRVNCLSPGGLQTPDMPERFVKQYSQRTQLGRMANNSDLKGAIVFLASDASSYITGANIPVDGGYTAK